LSKAKDTKREEYLGLYNKARNFAIVMGEYAQLAGLDAVDFAFGLSMARQLIAELRSKELVKDADDVAESLAKELRKEVGFPFPPLRYLYPRLAPKKTKEKLSNDEKRKRLYDKAKRFTRLIVTMGDRADLKENEFLLGVAMLEYVLSKTAKNWELYKDVARKLARGKEKKAKENT